MIYSVRGTIAAIAEHFVVVEVGGLGLKIATNAASLAGLPSIGTPISLFCHLHVPEGSIDLYGFKTQAELELFELLLSVSGVGPRSALSILDVADLSQLKAAIAQGRPDLLSKAAGVGKKTAERIIVELRNKVSTQSAEETVKKMETDTDLLETLAGLGYRRDDARAALARVGSEVTGLEERLKAALKLLSKR